MKNLILFSLSLLIFASASLPAYAASSDNTPSFVVQNKKKSKSKTSSKSKKEQSSVVNYGSNKDDKKTTPKFTFGKSDEEEEEEKKPFFDQYDKKYRPGTQLRIVNDRSLISNADVKAMLIRRPNATPNDITLHLQLGKPSVSGCLLNSNPHITATRDGNRMRVMIGDTSGPMPDQYTVRYAHYQCDMKSGVSSGDITFLKEELLRDGITEILISTQQVGMLLRMMIDLNAERLFVKSSLGIASFMARRQKIADTGFSPEYWFYPPGTLILSSNADPKDSDAQMRIMTLARMKGLTPLEEIFPEFRPSNANAGKVYVVDDKNLYGHELSSPNASTEIGTYETSEPFYGPNGQYQRKIYKDVSAHRPGLYE